MSPRRAHKSFVSAPPARSTTAPSQNRDPAGYPAWVRPLKEQYLQTLLSNTFGQTYYADQHQLIAEADKLHDQMMAEDPAFAAKAIVYARERGYMRTQPIYGLAKLFAVHGAVSLAAGIFDNVIRTPNDLADFAAIVKGLRPGAATKHPAEPKYKVHAWLPGSQGGRRIKRAAGRWMLNHLDDYRVVKYGADKSDGAYSLKDLLQVFHPNAGGRKLRVFDYIMGRPIEPDATLTAVDWYERLRRATTDEAKAQCITAGRLPHEVATAYAGSSKVVWNAIVPQLPIFALLRNLATLERHGVLEDNRALVEQKFKDRDTILKSKILPFRFIEAGKHVQSGWCRDALRDAIELACDNVLDVEGLTDVALDRSGSMAGYIQTASVFAVCLMKKSKLSGRLWLFNDMLEQFHASMRDSILTQASFINAGGGTNHSLVMNELLATGRKVANLIYITDEQQNQGTPLIDLIDRYRRTVNGELNVFIVDVSPYRNALTPNDPRTWYIYGWSDQVLNFISLAEKGFGSMVQAIEGGQEAAA